MNLYQLRVLQAAKAAHQFLTQDPPPPPLANATPSFQQQVSALKALIDAVGARGTEQIPETRKDRNTARDTAALQLRDGTLRPLREMARVIVASNAGVALGRDFPATIRVPKSTNVETILQAARLTAQKVAPYQSLFIARGLAPDFLAQLTAEANALEVLADDAHHARGTQVNATRDISRLLAEIRTTMRGLTVAVRRLCAQDGAQGDVTYHTWQRLKRPHRPSLTSDATDTTGATANTAKVATPAPAPAASTPPVATTSAAA